MYSYPPLVNIGYSLPYVAVFCMYLCAYLISGSKTWKQYFNYSHAVFFVLLVYFIDLHFKNIDSTLNNVNEMLNQPAQKIRKFNQKILLYFIAGTGIFIFLALIFRLDRGIVALGQGLLWLIRY